MTTYQQKLVWAQLESAAQALIKARGNPAARHYTLERIRKLRQRLQVSKEVFFDCFRQVVRAFEAGHATALKQVWRYPTMLQ